MPVSIGRGRSQIPRALMNPIGTNSWDLSEAIEANKITEPIAIVQGAIAEPSAKDYDVRWVFDALIIGEFGAL